jgi:F-type H+-transporting ATPase subunit b
MRFKKLAAVAGLALLAVVGPMHGASAAKFTVPDTTVVAEGEAPAADAEVTTSGTETARTEKLSKPSKECIEILEKGEPVENCVKAPNVILPAASELLFGSLAFLILLAGMWKFALPALKKTTAARSAKIAGDLASAEKAKTDSDKMIAEYQAKLSDAKAEGEKIREEARQQAEAIRKDMLTRAEADADAVRAKATDDLNAQATRIKGELESHVKTLSLELAEKVVGANMNRETNAALVDRYIAELGSK